MITIVMLGLAGCPKKEAATGGQTAATPAAGTAGEDQTAAANEGE